jgi:DNA polymerase-1|tara:strand:- start:338 stop:1168 length:831 start_codon:yes stop_codon:yes gene_type:complete
VAFSFSDQMEGMAGRTLVVDALNLAFRWKHAGRTDFRNDYVATVQSLAASYKCSNIIITADWGSSTYRKDILPEYKLNRKEKYDKQTEEEAQAFKDFFEEYEETLELLATKYTVLRFKGVEADDLAAHLVKQKKQYKLDEIWLVSSDRDWDLLIQEGVSRFSYVTRKEVTIENWSEHYNVSPEEYISFKCLTGDKGDNVPGITGIGPKRAEQLIKDYGDAMTIYDNVPIPGHYKYIQELNANADVLLKNYELMDLVTYCDDAIGTDNISEIQGRMV